MEVNITHEAKPIIVRLDKNYGQTCIYPVSNAAEQVALMLKRKTLSRLDLLTLKSIGHQIIIEDMSEEAMKRHEKSNWSELQ
jgi:hypothetical protein